MNINKLLIILIAIVAGIGSIGFIAYMIFMAQAPTSDQSPDQTPVTTTNTNTNNTTNAQTPSATTGTTPVVQNGDVAVVEVEGGGTIETKNLKKDPELFKDVHNPGYYYLGYNPAATTTTAKTPYIIGYIESTSFFNIVLLEEPIGRVREEAQTYLMQHVGITEVQMCKLKYMVSVPYSVNHDFASINLGFSFCPGAEAL